MLPEGAKFCLQCGAPVPENESIGWPAQKVPAEPPPPLDFVQPALAGGMILGLLSSIPLINLGNYFCCMWVLAGGAFAAYLLIQQRPGGIHYGDGAFGGVLSGLFGALVSTLMSIPVRLLAAGSFQEQRQAMEDAFRQYPDLDSSMRDFMLRMVSPEISAPVLTFIFVTNVLVFSLFAMIGGILMVAVMERRKVKGK